ncbi:MAG: ATPase [Desulfuromonas sp.]|nr:MAG: ATPase [Desulfuromonas sp.]
MKQILFLTPPDTIPGFSLTGVRQQETVAERAWESLEAASRDPELGVIAIDARLLDTIDPRKVVELTRRWRGVLVTLPAPAGTVLIGEDELQRLVRRALGYHVRLES